MRRVISSGAVTMTSERDVSEAMQQCLMILDMGGKRISRDETVAAVSLKPTNSERPCFKLTHLRRKGLIYATHPITVFFVDCL